MKNHPIYSHLLVSEDGKIFSTKTNRYLKTLVNDGGYEVFATRLQGRTGPSKLLRVHRLVCETYLENTHNLPFVNHKDSNKLNNSVSNLEWITSKGNSQHAKEMGLLRRISRDSNPLTILTTDDISHIKSIHIPRHKDFGLRALAKKYGVTHPTLSRLVRAEGVAPSC